MVKSILVKLLRSPRTIYKIIYRRLVKTINNIRLKNQNRLFSDAVKKLYTKEQINVVFFVLFSSTWKLESVYRLMKNHVRFNPIIFICPIVDSGKEYMLEQLDNTYSFFYERGYEVYKAYDEKSQKYINVRNEFNPDIIFYTNPYDGLVDDRYNIKNYSNILSCYVSYAFSSINAPYTYNMTFHNSLWRFYLENENMRDFYNSKLGYNRLNHVPVGYPSFDLLDKAGSELKDGKYKYIIWAPHHTLEPEFGVLHRDSFIRYADYMLNLLHKYRDKVFFIFRPHPLLKNKLYNHPDWGKSRTDDYYDVWNSSDNSLLSETRDYIDDFLLSDAMIHDSGSFTVEYLFTLKPVLFLGDKDPIENITPSAHEAFKCYSFANNEEDIEEFIHNLLNNKIDPLYDKKKQFKKNYLKVNSKLVAENILDDILQSIYGEKCN